MANATDEANRRTDRQGHGGKITVKTQRSRDIINSSFHVWKFIRKKLSRRSSEFEFVLQNQKYKTTWEYFPSLTPTFFFFQMKYPEAEYCFFLSYFSKTNKPNILQRTIDHLSIHLHLSA